MALNAFQRHRRRITLWVRVLKLSRGSCVDCGAQYSLDFPFSHDFDHLDPADKLGTVRRMFVERGHDAGLREATKCDLVCRPCHKARTRARRKAA